MSPLGEPTQGLMAGVAASQAREVRPLLAQEGVDVLPVSIAALVRAWGLLAGPHPHRRTGEAGRGTGLQPGHVLTVTTSVTVFEQVLLEPLL